MRIVESHPSVTVLVLGPTGATIIAGAAGSYQRYGAGVEVTKQWADRQQRLAIYENREKQTKFNLEFLDQYVDDFKEKKIYGELKNSAASVSKTCRDVDNTLRQGVEAQAEAGDIKIYTTQVRLIKQAAEKGKKAKSDATEIAELGNKVKNYEDKTIKGFEWAQEHSADCRNKEEASRIKKIFEDSTNLAAKIKGFSILAHKKNDEIIKALSGWHFAEKALSLDQMKFTRVEADAEAARNELNAFRLKKAEGDGEPEKASGRYGEGTAMLRGGKTKVSTSLARL